ncbi:MAG: redoxin domain-containing protein [Dehalococcoidia bacterium]
MNVSLQRNKTRFGRRTLVLLALALLGLLVAQGCTSSSQGVTDGPQGEPGTVGPREGQLAPDFTLVDLEGNTIRLSDYRGKTVFLNFWATRCPPCRAEMPEIESLYQEYKDRDVVVIGIDLLEPETTVRQYVEHGGFNWTFVIETTGEVANDYRVAAIPISFFVDREGIIKVVNIGAMTKRAMEAKLIEAMK